MIKNIVFDLGGVLIGWDPKIPFIKAFGGDVSQAENFIANICDYKWNLELDKGLPFDEGIKQKQKQFPEFAEIIPLYKSEWVSMLTGTIHGTVKILENLKKNEHYRLYAITNFSAETFPIAKKKYPFLNHFEDIVVSGEVNMIKPDRDIFYYAFNRFQITPTESVFIDDNADNIRTAQELGLNAIHFKTPELLNQELKRLEITF